MNKTSIEWTDYTWNPVTGCSKISQGCKHCYADTMNTRFGKGKKFTDVICHEDRLDEPLKMRSRVHGKKVFVCDVSDLFHEDVPFVFISSVFSVMQLCYHTTFQVLTKRPDRAAEFYKLYFETCGITDSIPNIWIGTSVEDQKAADERLPFLVQIPAAVRFISCEPLIESVDLADLHRYGKIAPFYDRKIHWVIAGGESGNRKSVRPMHPQWVRLIRDQCDRFNIPFFFKQWGDFLPIGQDQWVSENEFFDFTIYNHKEFYHKLGKSKAGNYLDGKQHLNFPMV